MAYKIKDIYPSQTTTGDAGWPDGKPRNIQGGVQGTGTPFEEKLFQDYEGARQALFDEAGIEPSGQADRVGQSDFVDALQGFQKPSTSIINNDGSTVQEYIDGQQFASVDAVKAYSKLSKLIGQRITTGEHHTGTGYGGATYEVVSSGSVTPNGIDIIQGVSDIAAAIKLDCVYVTPEMFGIYNNNTTNEVLRWERLLSCGKTIIPSSDAKYSVDEVITVDNKDVHITDSSATLVFNSDTAQINFNYTYTDLQAVLSVDNTATIDMSDGTAGTTTPVTKLSVSNASLYSEGDSVKVISDDIINGADPSKNERIGEHAFIFKIIGNDIYLGNRLIVNSGNYSTNCRLAKSSGKTFNLGSIKVDGVSSEKGARNLSHIVVRGCNSPCFSGTLYSKNTKAAFLNLLSCNEPQVASVVSLNGITDLSAGAFAHSVLLTSGTTNFFINSVYGRRMRHLVDTTAYPSSENDEVFKYGGVVGGFCQTVLGVEMQAAPASTHNDSDNIRFGSVISIKPVHGVSGYMGCVGFRGRNHHVDYVDSDEGVGVYAFNDFNDVDNSRGHTVGKIISSNTGILNRGRAFQVSGGTVAKVDLTIEDVIWKAKGNNNKSYIGSATNGKVRVSEITAIGGSVNNTVNLFEIFDGGFIEISKFKGRDLGLFNLCNFSSDDAVFKLNSADIESGLTWGYLATLNNHNCTFRLNDCTVDTNGSSSELIQDRGNSANIIADWVVTSSQYTAVRNRRRLPTIIANTPSSYDVDISDCGNRSLFQKIVTTSAAQLGDITNGNFYGQTITISNDFTSTSDLTIPDNSDGVRLNSTVVLAPSEVIKVFWTGFEWVRV